MTVSRPAPALISDACGAHLAVDPSELDQGRDLVRSRCGYEARLAHFPIAGLCPGCWRE